MSRLVNTCNIDSIYGNRRINLLRGDITDTNSELIVFSTHSNEGTNVEGHTYEALKRQYKLNLTGEDNAKSEIGDVKTQYWRERCEKGNQGFLMVRMPTYKGVEELVSNYDKNIKAIFASIRALEFNDVIFSSISVPVIEGEKDLDYYEGIKILLKYSLKYLKESKNTYTINFYILEEEQEVEWSNAFEKNLGRTYYKQGSLAVIESLIEGLKETIGRIFKDGGYKELEYVLRLIIRELDKLDSLSINSIAINSRKISEIIAKDIASRKQININKIKYDLSAILNLLASKDILAPWVVQYLHTARVFGNKTAHVETAIKYKPDKLYNSDFISILASLYNILNFWYYNKEEI